MAVDMSGLERGSSSCVKSVVETAMSRDCRTGANTADADAACRRGRAGDALMVCDVSSTEPRRLSSEDKDASGLGVEPSCRWLAAGGLLIRVYNLQLNQRG